MDRRSVLGLAAWPLCSVGANAAPLRQPAGAVVLTLTGKLRQPNRDGTAVFDMPMLAALPQHEFSTRTPWYPTPRRFKGPLLRDLLAAAGAHGTQVRARALNDYFADIPFSDTQQHDLLLAYLLDGQPITVREKGPLQLMYPLEQKPELRNALYYSRCVWQLLSLEVS